MAAYYDLGIERPFPPRVFSGHSWEQGIMSYLASDGLGPSACGIAERNEDRTYLSSGARHFDDVWKCAEGDASQI